MDARATVVDLEGAVLLGQRSVSLSCVVGGDPCTADAN